MAPRASFNSKTRTAFPFTSKLVSVALKTEPATGPFVHAALTPATNLPFSSREETTHYSRWEG